VAKTGQLLQFNQNLNFETLNKRVVFTKCMYLNLIKITNLFKLKIQNLDFD